MFRRNFLLIFAIFLSVFTSKTYAKELLIEPSTLKIEIPFADGENYIFTVKIEGNAQNVRLSTNPSSEEGISLAITDDEYQINLTDDDVIDLLNSVEEKQFYILADNENDETFSSIAISYTIKPPNIYLVTSGGIRMLLNNQAYHTHDISSIEIEKSNEVVVVIGKSSRLFKNDNIVSEALSETTLLLPIYDEIREQWQSEGELALMIDESDTPVIIKAKPRLIIDKLPQLFTLDQNQTKSIAGTNDNLKISIGDINRGFVNVTVSGNNSGNKHNLAESTTMSRYDKLLFNYAGQDYQLVLSELYNSIHGIDYVNFIFAPQMATEAQKINALISHLQLTRKILIVDDKPYSRQQIGSYFKNTFNFENIKEISLEKLIKTIKAIEAKENFTHTFKSNHRETLVKWLRNAHNRLAL